MVTKEQGLEIAEEMIQEPRVYSIQGEHCTSIMSTSAVLKYKHKQI
jgi:hypothetical protein